MFRKTTILFAAALFAAGCASSSREIAGPRQFEGPKPQPPAAKLALQIDLPAGWNRQDKSPVLKIGELGTLLTNDANVAMVMIGVFPTEKIDIKAGTEKAAAELRAKGAKVSEIEAATDGSSAGFTWQDRKAKMAGAMLARVMPEKPELSILFMGIWQLDKDKASLADYNAIAKSAKIK
jgi:hypothetical protein